MRWKVDPGWPWGDYPGEFRAAMWEAMVRELGVVREGWWGGYMRAAWATIQECLGESGGWIDEEEVERIVRTAALCSPRPLPEEGVGEGGEGCRK